MYYIIFYLHNQDVNFTRKIHLPVPFLTPSLPFFARGIRRLIFFTTKDTKRTKEGREEEKKVRR